MWQLIVLFIALVCKGLEATCRIILFCWAHLFHTRRQIADRHMKVFNYWHVSKHFTVSHKCSHERDFTSCANVLARAGAVLSGAAGDCFYPSTVSSGRCSVSRVCTCSVHLWINWYLYACTFFICSLFFNSHWVEFRHCHKLLTHGSHFLSTQETPMCGDSSRQQSFV